MDILTKICIVVLVLLTLVASAVFINLATEPVSWRQQYQQASETAEAFKLQARNARLATVAARRDLQSFRATSDTEKKQMTSRINELEGQLETAKNRYAEQSAKLTELANSVAELEANYKQVRADRKLLEQQLAKAQENYRELQKERNTLWDELQTVTRNYEAVAQLSQAQAETIADLRQKLKEAQQAIARGGGTGDQEDARPVATGEVINGTIRAVRDDVASINIGSAQGVKPNMELTIYRTENGGRYVGKLRVSEVSVNEAGGVVFDKQFDPRPGDKVTNDLDAR